jgi:GrpB-like predicted nucleotidyltransferase (UPF0157 family)
MEDGRIMIHPYDPEWAKRFEAERLLLEDVLAEWLCGGVHHVGATSVRGLAAKPMIDMIAGVRDLDEAREAFEPLRAHGYVYDPHRPDEAHHFAKPSTRLSGATHGLHLTIPGSNLWRERFAFRDALRANGALVAEYEELKLRLAVEHGDDITAYTTGKRPFVRRVLANAGVHLAG